jgi:hypothetical protein
MLKSLNTHQVGNMAGVVSLVESIEELFDQKPDKRKKAEYKEWIEKINTLILQVNKESKFKMYEKIK